MFGSNADETSRAADCSPGGAADNSLGRKSWVDEKKENNSTLPKELPQVSRGDAIGGPLQNQQMRPDRIALLPKPNFGGTPPPCGLLESWG